MQAGSPDRVDRRLAAIFAADVVGYSRLMEADEAGTARVLREHRAATVWRSRSDSCGSTVPTLLAAVRFCSNRRCVP